MNDQELELLMRAGLRQHADDARTDPTMLTRVQAAKARSQRGRWAGLAAAAAAVIGIGATTLIVAGNDPDTMPAIVDDPQVGVLGPTRPESWGGLTVDVPANWGYGTGLQSNQVSEQIGANACNPMALRGPDGQPLPGDGDPSLGWVGRPISLTDVCADAPSDSAPTAPYVLLGAGIPTGEVTLGNGYVEETVKIEGVTLTVGSSEEAFREAIIESARTTTTCKASFADTIPSGRAALTREGRGELRGAKVCAYRYVDGQFLLTYTASIAPEQAAAAYRAQERAPNVTHDDACMGDLTEFVLLDATYEDPAGSGPLERRAVYELGCGGEVDLGGGGRTHLVLDGVAPWARNGISAVVSGPSSPSEPLTGYFIGLVG